MTPAELKSARADVIKSLKRTVKPHLHASGYRTGKIGASKPLLLWVPQKDGKATLEDIPLKDGFSLHEFQGFVADGLITDIHCGLVTQPFSMLALEDLYRLSKWVSKRFGQPPAKAKRKKSKSKQDACLH